MARARLHAAAFTPNLPNQGYFLLSVSFLPSQYARGTALVATVLITILGYYFNVITDILTRHRSVTILKHSIQKFKLRAWLLRHCWRRSRRTRKEITQSGEGGSGPDPLGPLRAWAKPSPPFGVSSAEGVLCSLAGITKVSTGCSL